MRVGDVLRNKGTRIATVRMSETVATAARLMRAGNISALVVKDVCRTEGNVAVGMFSERDVVRAVADYGPQGLEQKISELISVQRLVACSSGDSVAHVRGLMNRHHIRHLPVIDDHTLVGVISMRDINATLEVDDAAPVRLPPVEPVQQSQAHA